MGKGGGHGGHGGHGHGRGYGRGRGRGRGRYGSSGGAGGVGCDGYKEDYIGTVVAFGIISFVLGALLVVLLCVIPLETGRACVYFATLGEQSRCLVSSFGNDVLIYSEKATVYQYSYFSSPSSSEWRNYSYTYREVIPKNSHVSLNLTRGAGTRRDYYNVSLHYKLSSPGDIYVMDSIAFDHFKEGELEIDRMYEIKKGVTDWVYDYYGTESGLHIVVFNNGKEPITVDEEGRLRRLMYIFNESKADAVFKPGTQYRIKKLNMSEFYVEYEGEERSVPVTLLYDYGFNPSLIGVLTSVPVFFAPFFVLFIVFFCCWCHSESYKDEEAAENKVSQTPAEGGVPMEGVAAGAGPESAPPPAAYETATPDAAPTPEGSATMPSYPGETDVYGIPVAP